MLNMKRTKVIATTSIKLFFPFFPSIVLLLLTEQRTALTAIHLIMASYRKCSCSHPGLGRKNTRLRAVKLGFFGRQFARGASQSLRIESAKLSEKVGDSKRTEFHLP